MGIDRLIALVALFIFIFGSTAFAEDSMNNAAVKCSYSNISIHSIQGAGHRSPVVGCWVSGVQGIVTLNTSNGFYIQDIHTDNNSSTSEGIFVFTKSYPNNVKKGDIAYVSGTVSEYQSDKYSLSLTEIVNPTYATTGNKSSLAPVLLGKGGRILPDTVIEDDTFGDIATNNSVDPNIDGIDFYESLEGMLVKINDAIIIQPALPSKNQHAVVYVLGDNGSLANVRTPSGGIVLRPGDYNPERIMLDFFADSSDPINVGDRIKGPIVGVMSYSNNNYKIVVDKDTPLNVIRTITSKRSVADELTIATFNVENLAPKSGTNKFKMLAEQIVNKLGAPDILALEEIIGDGSAKDGSDIYKTLNILSQEIKNISSGKIQYINVSIPDKTSNQNIAILYKTDRGLTFQGLPVDNPTTNVSIIDGPHLSPNPGWVNPDNLAFQKSRKPLAVEFTFKNQSLFIIANHFKSKIEDTPLYGEIQPPIRITENQRHKQAQVVNDFIEELLNVDPMANVVVLGDLNDFQFSETLNILKGNLLSNLLENLSIGEQYTTNFEGNSQAIDHILISKSLLNKSPEIDVVHFNSDFAIKTSDHDPVVLKTKFSKA
jgi:predicted extracellular nuclease